MAEARQRKASLAVTDPDAGDGLRARIQALFAEAHRRRRRRWRRLAYALIGELHVGDVATLTQRVVAAVPAWAGTSWLLQVGGQLYAGGSSVIRQVVTLVP